MDDSKYKVYPNGSLSILDIHKDDEGTYNVELSYEDGSITWPITVEVVKTRQ